MSVTPESDPILYIRLLIGDPEGVTFTDDEVQSVLHFDGHPKLAAATLIDRIAGSELLLSKKIQSQDLATDGPAVAKELRALAQTLRQQYADDLAEASWGIASWTVPLPASRPEATEVPW